MSQGKVFFGEAAETITSNVDVNSLDLVYIDPPFNTGVEQRRGEMAYNDAAHKESIQYIYWLEKHLYIIRLAMKDDATIYVHCDPRESHYIKVMMDSIFGRNHFINEIIWAYDYGGRSKKRWPAKHDVILMYSKGDNFAFNYRTIERIPYMAPGLVSLEKAKFGKIPTDVWWHTIVGTMSKEKTGYPTQKPLAIVARIVAASSNIGDTVLDCFAGSGTTGEACLIGDRNFILIDNNMQAIDVMRKRFKSDDVKFYVTETDYVQ